MSYRISFEGLPWVQCGEGIRHKVHRRDGLVLRLVEYDSTCLRTGATEATQALSSPRHDSATYRRVSSLPIQRREVSPARIGLQPLVNEESTAEGPVSDVEFGPEV